MQRHQTCALCFKWARKYGCTTPRAASWLSSRLSSIWKYVSQSKSCMVRWLCDHHTSDTGRYRHQHNNNEKPVYLRIDALRMEAPWQVSHATLRQPCRQKALSRRQDHRGQEVAADRRSQEKTVYTARRLSAENCARAVVSVRGQRKPKDGFLGKIPQRSYFRCVFFAFF